MSEGTSTEAEAAASSEEDLLHCAMPSCRYSAPNLQQWNLQTCSEHKDQQNINCGCKPSISLHPLPADENVKEQCLRAFNLPSDIPSGAEQIKICSVHFEKIKPLENSLVLSVLEREDDIGQRLTEELSIHQNVETLSDTGAVEKKDVSSAQSPGRGLSDDGQKTCEDTAIAVLSSRLKRPAESDAEDDDGSYGSKKQCVGNEGELKTDSYEYC